MQQQNKKLDGALDQQKTTWKILNSKINSLRNIPNKIEISSHEAHPIPRYRSYSNDLLTSNHGKEHNNSNRSRNESRNNFTAINESHEGQNPTKSVSEYQNFPYPDEGGLILTPFEKQSRGSEGSSVSRFKEDDKLTSSKKSNHREKKNYRQGSWDLPPKSSHIDSSRKSEHIPDDKKFLEYLKSANNKGLTHRYENENIYRRNSKTKSEANLLALGDSKFMDEWQLDSQHKRSGYHSAKKPISQEKDVYLKDEINLLDNEIEQIQEVLKKEFGLDH